MFPSRIASVLGGSAGLPNTYSLAFDGTDDYVTDSTANFRSSDSSGTISFWAKTNSDAYEYFISSGDTGSTTSFLGIAHKNSADGGDVYIYQQNDADTIDSISGSTNILDNNWHHIVITSDGSSYLIYVDGVSETLSVDGGANNGDWFADTTGRNNFTIGALHRSSVVLPFNGNIDEVSIWNTALSAGDISALYQAKGTANLNDDGNSANLKGWWRMGDGRLDSFNLIADQVNPTLGSELITNGSMEADANWGDSDVAPTSQERSSEQAKNGTYSWKFVTPGSGGARYGGIKNTTAFTTVTGNVYRLKYWIRANVTSHNLSIIEGDGSGKITGFSDKWVTGQTADQWNEIIYYYTESSGGSGGYVEFEGSGGAATFYIDDVSIVQVNGNPGIMTNMASDDIVKDTP